MCIFRVENFIGGGAEMDPKSGGPIIENDICPPPLRELRLGHTMESSATADSTG